MHRRGWRSKVQDGVREDRGEVRFRMLETNIFI